MPVYMVITIVACAVVVAGLWALWYLPQRGSTQIPGTTSPPYTGTMVVVTDVDLIVDYWTNNSNDTSYLEDPSCDTSSCTSPGLFSTPECPPVGCANVSPGAVFLFNFTVVDNDTIGHTILSIVVNAPFAVTGTVPTVPFSLTPGIAVNITLEITAASTPGEYDMTGAINTS